MAHPENARIGLLNQYAAAMLNGRLGRALYKRLRSDRGPSRTRQNIDRVSEQLGGYVLEFNVVCYATSMGSDLTQTKNPGGKDAGQQVGLDVLAAARLPVLIVHGSKAVRKLDPKPTFRLDASVGAA